MNSNFCVLPTDIIHLLVSQTLEKDAESLERKREPRMLRLPHPRTGLPTLFLPTECLSEVDHKLSILEIQAVTPPDERSWIVGEEIIADGKLLVMTPVDPSFLLLPILLAIQKADGSTTPFRPADDLFEDAAKALETSDDTSEALSISSRDIIDFSLLRCVRKSLSHICDVKEITTEIAVYRYSPDKATGYMRQKVARLTKCQAFEDSQTLVRTLAKDGLMEDGKDELLTLGRSRAACDLISQYLPPAMREALVNSYDFVKLDKYLATNKEEAVVNALRTIPVKAQTKAQKAAADKKRKAVKPSNGVEKLKKVNTTGMSKLSSFFSKA